jgi:hypothetical protein
MANIMAEGANRIVVFTFCFSHINMACFMDNALFSLERITLPVTVTIHLQFIP